MIRVLSKLISLNPKNYCKNVLITLSTGLVRFFLRDMRMGRKNVNLTSFFDLIKFEKLRKADCFQSNKNIIWAIGE